MENISHLDPENVRKIKNHVYCLLAGLDAMESHPINLLEQATGLEQLAQELRAISAGRIAA
ncbi:hypothetical protein LEP3755_01770 [Leptolyngbya sp. NIES-3755]|nr:hypothetical protein LEP3755_01770 [Leptolyngbya sp. NIES-3755]